MELETSKDAKAVSIIFIVLCQYKDKPLAQFFAVGFTSIENDYLSRIS
jgi:hypothetical protein